MKSIDLNANQIVNMPDMKSANARLSAELLDDAIYVFGGATARNQVEK